METHVTQWLKVSDGTPAVDMQVELATPWVHVGIKNTVGFMAKTPAGPVGAYAVDFAIGDIEEAQINPDLVVAFPTAAIAGTPVQPTGAACVTGLKVDSLGSWTRARWTPTTGQEAAGEGHLPDAAAFTYSAKKEG
jgi:hypothetical protein